MQASEALFVALGLHARPAQAPAMREAPLPVGMTLLIRVAGGNPGALAEAAELTGTSQADLVEAARFFIEQQLLSRECEIDPWRVLGLSPGADEAALIEHRRLLVSLVHPDRSDDWAGAYTDRVQRAWRALKDPEERARLAATMEAAARPPAPTAADTDDAWFESDRSSNGDEGTGRWDRRPDPESLTPVSLGGGLALRAAMAQAPEPVRAHPALRYGIAATVAALLISSIYLMWSDGQNTGPFGTSATSMALPGSSARTDPAPIAEAPGESADEAADEPQILAALDPIEDAGAADGLDSAPTRLTAESSGPSQRSMVAEVPGPEPRASALRPVATQVAPPLRRASVEPASSTVVTRPPARQTAASLPVRTTPPPSADVQTAAADRPARATRPTRRPIEQQASDAESSQTLAAVEPTSAEPVAADLLVAEPEVAAPVATPATLVQAPPPDDVDVIVALDRFAQRYADGNLDQFLALFATARLRDQGAALAADYSRLFNTTRRRTLELRDLRWSAEGDRLKGRGTFEATYQSRGKFGKQVVRGRLEFELVRDGDQVRFVRLDSHPSGGQG